MPYSTLLTASVFGVFSLLTMSSVAANDIYSQQLFKLNEVNTTDKSQRIDNSENIQRHTLEVYRGQSLLTSFFMPKCAWCFRQHKALSEIGQLCQGVSTVLLGVRGNKHQLTQELKRKKAMFPAYKANTLIQQAVGENAPVPMILAFDAVGELKFKTQGYVTSKQLLSLLQTHKLASCS